MPWEIILQNRLKTFHYEPGVEACPVDRILVEETLGGELILNVWAKQEKLLEFDMTIDSRLKEAGLIIGDFPLFSPEKRKVFLSKNAPNRFLQGIYAMLFLLSGGEPMSDELSEKMEKSVNDCWTMMQKKVAAGMPAVCVLRQCCFGLKLNQKDLPAEFVSALKMDLGKVKKRYALDASSDLSSQVTGFPGDDFFFFLLNVNTETSRQILIELASIVKSVCEQHAASLPAGFNWHVDCTFPSHRNHVFSRSCSEPEPSEPEPSEPEPSEPSPRRYSIGG